MRSCFYLAILLSVVPCAIAAEPEDFSPGTIRAVENFEADLIQLRLDFDRDVAKAKAELEKRLEYELKNVLRKGDLKSANALKEIQAKAKSRTGLEKINFMGKPVDTNLLVAKLRPTDYVVSHGWMSPKGPFRFVPNEKKVLYRGTVGFYRVEGNKIFYTLTSGNQHWLVLSPNPKILIYEGVEQWPIIEK